MEVNVYLAAAELCLILSSALGHLAVLLVLLQYRLSMLVAPWQRISSTAMCLLRHLQVTINKVNRYHVKWFYGPTKNRKPR